MKPIMKLGGLDVYQLSDITPIRGLVRLTKWLMPIQSEFDYLHDECVRISRDRTRLCYIAFHQGKLALYVNDLTGGIFDTLGEE